MSSSFGYEKLDVWQRAMSLVDRVYDETSRFPTLENFGLTGQMRRAAVSIPSNIAEGYGHGDRAFARHLRISRGSSFELRTQIEIARRQSYFKSDVANELAVEAAEISRMIEGLIRSLEPPVEH